MKKNTSTPAHTYSFYSNVLKQPFASVEELEKAEDLYFNEQKAKEDKAAQKKADAQKVEDAFKALNAERKKYKEDLTQLTQEYSNALTELKNAYEHGKKDIHSKLAKAEEDYQAALKEFTDKYDNYHMTLKDSDFETTISKQTSGDVKQPAVDYSKISDLFDLIFRF